MKFIPHTETVIQAFLKEYKLLVSAYENTDLFTLRDRMMKRYNIFCVCLTADLYHLLADTSKYVLSASFFTLEI